MTSTTPTPQTAEDVKDEVPAKSVESGLEAENKVEPAPPTREGVAAAEVKISFDLLNKPRPK